jgi:hypothetical protein
VTTAARPRTTTRSSAGSGSRRSGPTAPDCPPTNCSIATTTARVSRACPLSHRSRPRAAAPSATAGAGLWAPESGGDGASRSSASDARIRPIPL